MLKIRTYPDPVLREIAEPVTEFDEGLKRLVRDMADTMYSVSGVALAASQVGIVKRLFIVDLASPERKNLYVFINPKVIGRKGMITWDEGCLSLPGIRIKVKRSKRVVIRSQDVDGKPFTLEGEGLFAIAIQHELDHLEGKLLVDYIRRSQVDGQRR